MFGLVGVDMQRFNLHFVNWLELLIVPVCIQCWVEFINLSLTVSLNLDSHMQVFTVQHPFGTDALECPM